MSNPSTSHFSEKCYFFQLLVECGVVPAFDMTAEAALAKLSYVLTKTELTYQQKVEARYIS